MLMTSNENKIFLIYSTNFKFNMGASYHALFISVEKGFPEEEGHPFS